jgi:peptidoglycan-associated lipoprotein
LIMHRQLRSAGFLATLALLSVGCGHKTKPEMPEPVSQESSPADPPYTPSSVSVEPISENILDHAQRATLEERISFGFDQSDLSPVAREKLLAKAEILRAIPSLSLRIEGHADERGSDEYNLALSNRRAAAAMRFLGNHGISPDRLETVGYGEEQPLDPAENESAWARNRRDEFRVSSGRLAQQ